MTPKSLLRHREAISRLEDFSDGSFQHVIGEQRELDPEKVRRVLLCSGKVYYDLIQRAQEESYDDVAVLRVEQLYPLDRDTLSAEVGKYANASEVCWVQEEPKNMGSWSYLFPELFELFGKPPRYIGRVASASPATGDPQAHQLEQNQFITKAFAEEI